jgi:hypothetical protein
MRSTPSNTTHHAPLQGPDSTLPPKYFTVAEAERTLPLVRRIVADIMALYPRWVELVEQFDLATAQARPEWGESPEQLALRGAIDDVAAKISAYQAELEQLGCVFKGFEGLVDFYGKLDGRDIFWCWKHGEAHIGHWHEIEAGYAGRQPLPTVTTGGIT